MLVYPRGIPSHGQPHSIPACRSLRGNTVGLWKTTPFHAKIKTLHSLVFNHPLIELGCRPLQKSLNMSISDSKFESLSLKSQEHIN